MAGRLMTDWRALFIKYRRHVGECEGVDFLEPMRISGHFTPEEIEAIEGTEQETWPVHSLSTSPPRDSAKPVV